MSQTQPSDFFTEWSDSPLPDDLLFSRATGCHSVESQVARQLIAQPDLAFDRLVVRRLPGNSICLEGSVRIDTDSFDFDDYVKCLLGCDEVINRLSVKRSGPCGDETRNPGEDTVVDW